MIPLIRAALVALLVVATPASAADPGGGGVPLRTLCSSPTMDYCMNIWSWDFHYAVLAEMDWYGLQGRWHGGDRGLRLRLRRAATGHARRVRVLDQRPVSHRGLRVPRGARSLRDALAERRAVP